MISAAHEDDRAATAVSVPAPTVPVAPLVPVGVPAARRAPEREGGPMGLPALTPVPLEAIGAGDTGAVAGTARLDHLATELEVDAAAVTWALRLALLGVVGVVLMLAVLL